MCKYLTASVIYGQFYSTQHFYMCFCRTLKLNMLYIFFDLFYFVASLSALALSFLFLNRYFISFVSVFSWSFVTVVRCSAIPVSIGYSYSPRVVAFGLKVKTHFKSVCCCSKEVDGPLPPKTHRRNALKYRIQNLYCL